LLFVYVEACKRSGTRSAEGKKYANSRHISVHFLDRSPVRAKSMQVGAKPIYPFKGSPFLPLY
ncbi:hypothetical protein, partial [Sutcliffiella horikoshii]|uniref:hypothetical protein n=1 Tax=Sutcliffiella horikoshii TaxID=79883 RepID=UPI003CF7ACEF